MKATRNGQTLVMHPHHGKDVGTGEQLNSIRAFLERSSDGTAPTVAEFLNLLIVIDHRQAHIYKAEVKGSVPERIVPYDPDGSGRHLHYVANDSNGQRRPERRSYYEEIAESLHGADGILIFGGGTGTSSAMEQLVSELHIHHHELAERIVGSMVVDEHHMTDDQLLAKAREIYARITAEHVVRS